MTAPPGPPPGFVVLTFAKGQMCVIAERVYVADLKLGKFLRRRQREWARLADTSQTAPEFSHSGLLTWTNQHQPAERPLSYLSRPPRAGVRHHRRPDRDASACHREPGADPTPSEWGRSPEQLCSVSAHLSMKTVRPAANASWWPRRRSGICCLRSRFAPPAEAWRRGDAHCTPEAGQPRSDQLRAVRHT